MNNGKLKQLGAILSVILIIMGFGMIHSTTSIMEIVSILMIGAGTAFLLYLLFSDSKNNSEE